MIILNLKTRKTRNEVKPETFATTQPPAHEAIQRGSARERSCCNRESWDSGGKKRAHLKYAATIQVSRTNAQDEQGARAVLTMETAVHARNRWYNTAHRAHARHPAIGEEHRARARERLRTAAEPHSPPRKPDRGTESRRAVHSAARPKTPPSARATSSRYPRIGVVELKLSQVVIIEIYFIEKFYNVVEVLRVVFG